MIGVKKLFDGVLFNSASESQTSAARLPNTTKRVTFYIQAQEETGSNASLTFSVDVSPDKGVTLIDYDKLIDSTGVDSPIASKTINPGGTLTEYIVSMSAEDAVEYVSVNFVDGGSAGAAHTMTISCWVVYDY